MRRLLLVALLAACGSDRVEPAFPASYATTFVEVRDCRPSADHDLHKIRIVASPDAVGPYMSRTAPFPVGALVVKEEYDFTDDDCAGPIVEWTVMEKLDTTDDLGWHWERVAADRTITSTNESRCIGCHTACGRAPDGYDGTCAVP